MDNKSWIKKFIWNRLLLRIGTVFSGYLEIIEKLLHLHVTTSVHVVKSVHILNSTHLITNNHLQTEHHSVESLLNNLPRDLPTK